MFFDKQVTCARIHPATAEIQSSRHTESIYSQLIHERLHRCGWSRRNATLEDQTTTCRI